MVLRCRGLCPAWKSLVYILSLRRHPVLKINRRQLPLAPAFAITAHAAQGQTLKQGAIVDLRIGGSSSPMSSYVALTRVQRRQDLLIYRPFDIHKFNVGEKRGAALLLQLLRGEPVDWAAIENEIMPSKRCNGCKFLCYKPAFALSQWNKKKWLSVLQNVCTAERDSRNAFRM